MIDATGEPTSSHGMEDTRATSPSGGPGVAVLLRAKWSLLGVRTRLRLGALGLSLTRSDHIASSRLGSARPACCRPSRNGAWCMALRDAASVGLYAGVDRWRRSHDGRNVRPGRWDRAGDASSGKGAVLGPGRRAARLRELTDHPGTFQRPARHSANVAAWSSIPWEKTFGSAVRIDHSSDRHPRVESGRAEARIRWP